MNRITQEALEEKIERLEKSLVYEFENRYKEGFRDGLRVELHIATFDGKSPILSKENLDKIKLDIKKQLIDNRII